MVNVAWKEHWFNQGSTIGCAKPSGLNCYKCCENPPMEPTLKSEDQLTYRILDDKGSKISPRDTPFRMNPWLAPGHAPIAEVCGILGGWQYNNARDYIAGPGDAFDKFRNGTGGAMNGHLPPPTMSPPAGTKGTDVLQWDLNKRMEEAQGKTYATNNNIWKAGTTQNVSYSVYANHGGGFQYRLCKVEYLLNGTINEGCFQALEFVGEKAWFNYHMGDNVEKSISFTAKRVSDANTGGVLPRGSTWTQVALPACAGPYGGGSFGPPPKCDSPQFENEITDAGFWGYGFDTAGASPAFREVVTKGSYEIVDTVQVPEGFEGDYVVQWRWDSEQTPQIWTQCSIVTIQV